MKATTMQDIARFISEHGNAVVNVTASYVCFEVVYHSQASGSSTAWAYVRNMREARRELGY